MNARNRSAFYKIDTRRWAIVNEKIETVEGFIVLNNGRYDVQDIFNETLQTFDSLQEIRKWLN